MNILDKDFLLNYNSIIKARGNLFSLFNKINNYPLFKNKLFDIDTGNLKLIILVNGRAADDLNSNIKEDDKINIIT